jgi:hypothetical protein
MEVDIADKYPNETMEILSKAMDAYQESIKLNQEKAKAS